MNLSNNKPYNSQLSLIPLDGKPLTPPIKFNLDYTSHDAAIDTSQRGKVYIPLIPNKIDDYLLQDGFNNVVKGQINIPVNGNPITPSKPIIIKEYNSETSLILNDYKPIKPKDLQLLPYLSNKDLIKYLRSQKSDIEKRFTGFLNQQPFLASFKGIIPIPTIPGADNITEKLLLPPIVGQVANTAFNTYYWHIKHRLELLKGKVTGFNATDLALIAAKASVLLVKILKKEKQDWAALDYNYSKNRNLTPIEPNKRSSTKLWEDSDHEITYNPNTFQIKTNDVDIYKNTEDLKIPEGLEQDIIRFKIHDLNRKELMVTPAFITDLNDSGLLNEWLLIDYVNGVYPKFIYKGVSKRTILFGLMIMCFDRKNLNIYRNKVNFLRRAGLPYYKKVTLGGNKTFEYPQAPLYKLTLGSIILDQYGFFESCTLLAWELDLMSWNLLLKKLWYDVSKKENNTPSDNEFLFPLFSLFSIKFTCLYGTPPELVFKWRGTS